MDGNAHQKAQQTIKLAIDCRTDELLPAETLLAMPEVDFTALRREAMEARVARRRTGSQDMRLLCAICKAPLFISRRYHGAKNRWFVHDETSEDCPWFESNRLTPEQIKALVYWGQQEGRQHRALKEFIAHWLRQEPLVEDVALERTTFSQVVQGEWRRPDVQCTYQGVRLVFEIQLSYTFLSDVIERDAFYKRENTFIIWVFANFGSNRAAITDEAFFNRRNLFVLDTSAREQSKASGALVFNGYHQDPHLLAGHHWQDDWTSRPIRMKDIIFPKDTYRPYFFDYEAHRQKIQAELAASQLAEAQKGWDALIQAYRAAAMMYFDAIGSAEPELQALLHIVGTMERHSFWRQSLGGLRAPRFYGHRGVMAILMSIQQERPITYNRKLSVFQVMEAGLRSGSSVGQHANAVLYLRAYKTYRPAMTDRHKQWMSHYAHEVKNSWERGETTYLRDTTLDAAIAQIFPDLKLSLEDSFATWPTTPEPPQSKTANYQDRVFKTRLEAQWAAFFDLIGWSWQVKPEAIGDWEPDFQVDIPCGHSECNDYHRLLVSVVPTPSIDDQRGHPALGYSYGMGPEDQMIGVDSGAVFGLDPSISSFEISHGAGGGEYSVAEFAGIRSWSQTWNQAGRRVS